MGRGPRPGRHCSVEQPDDIYTVDSSGFIDPIPTISYYKGLTRPDPIILR